MKQYDPDKMTWEEYRNQPLTPEDIEELEALYEARISAPITNYRIWTDEEVEEARRQGLID